MVNTHSPNGAAELADRPRAEHASALGATQLNPFGDLISLQHLSVRLTKGLGAQIGSLCRREVAVQAEPLVVQRYADYQTERGEALSAWLPLKMGPRHAAQIVIEGVFAFELLDAFFGGDGDAPEPLPDCFSPAAHALLERTGQLLETPLSAAWESLAPVALHAEACADYSRCQLMGDDSPVIVTRFTITAPGRPARVIDILYPVAALKPHGAALAENDVRPAVEAEPEWRSGLTRAVMGVKLPVRSILCEPRIALGRLMGLKAGDIIPIEIDQDVPVYVATNRIGTGTVGTSNGQAAVRLSKLEPINPEEFR